MPSGALTQKPRRKRQPGTEKLDVAMNGVHVGLLERAVSGALSFAYAQSWLERDRPIPLSLRFPLRETEFVGQPVRDYFDNLLPDDRRVREKLAAHVRASGTQTFDLLSALGRDCVGALQFYPLGEEPGPVKPAKGRPVSAAEIADTLRNLRVNPLGIDRERDFRISLAGAQNKTALLRQGGEWHWPEGATPTTHILKPAIGPVPDGPDLTLSVENEWLCLKLLEAFGLKSASVEMASFEGVRVLVVTRFDRSWSGQKLYRLPQEDLCQALGLSPAAKYQADGGPGIAEIMAVLNESDRRDSDRRDFMKAQLVYWLLAAIDGHTKNFSLFLRPRGFVLTPFYDVMSADPHLNPRTLPSQKAKLAMSVGANRHYRIREILPRHWRQTAKQVGFNSIEELLAEVIDQTAEAIRTVEKALPRGFPAKISDPIFRGITVRAKILADGS